MARFSLPWLLGFPHVRHRADKFVVWILVLDFLKFIQECGVLRTAIRVKEVQRVGELVLRRLQNDASKGSDTNSADKEHRGTRSVGMKREGTKWSRDPDFTPQTECSKYTFESCIAHSRRHCKIGLKRRA